MGHPVLECHCNLQVRDPAEREAQVWQGLRGGAPPPRAWKRRRHPPPLGAAQKVLRRAARPRLREADVVGRIQGKVQEGHDQVVGGNQVYFR